MEQGETRSRRGDLLEKKSNTRLHVPEPEEAVQRQVMTAGGATAIFKEAEKEALLMQVDSNEYSNCLPTTLDIQDPFFSQEGFTYTGLLLGQLANSSTSGQSNVQVDTQSWTKRIIENVNTLDNNRFDWADTGTPTQYHATQEKETCPTSSTSLDDNDNPWEVDIFNNIQLEEVLECENMSSDKRTEPNFTQTMEENTQSGVYQQDAPMSNENGNDNATDESAEQHREIRESDVETFLALENLAAEGMKENVTESNSQVIPEIGMEFESRNEAQNFFNLYAYRVGFSVCCVSSYRTVSKKRNNEVIRFTMKCNKYGRNTDSEKEQLAQRQSTVIAKTDCKVEVVVSEKNGLWRITGLELLHNHGLCPQSRFFRSHVYMSDGEKELIRTMKHCNMPTRDMVAVLAYIRGGMSQLPYNKRKVSNYCTSINREMTNTDMMEVLSWFSQKRKENPGFYSAIDLDESKKVRSVFWSDARARLYYDICGDCISFDTTFLTNKYNLPFAPFVGVSPHGRTYLFACAFIVNESSDGFSWCFNQFKEAMGGKCPKTIITDQDKGMEKAIPLEFLEAIHRCCLFHIKKKIDDKGGTVFQANEGLYEELQDIIDNSLTVNEFETLWQAMIVEYNVGHVKIFQDLWKTRTKWVPVYFKKHFFPFIQTTARSEGTNALFKRGVGAQFSITSFLREYQRIMDTMHANEDECDHNAINKRVPEKKFLTKYYIERQAHELYNIAIFRKFQKILNDVTRLQLSEEEKGKTYWVFQAKNYPIKEHRARNYLVQLNEETQDYSCICCKFEKDGLLCSHILKVMLHLDVEKIPEKYIIDRWRKKERKLFTHLNNPIVPTPNEDSIVLRFNVLSRMLGHTASNGSKNKRKYQYLLQEIPRLEAEMAKMDSETEPESAMAQNSSTRTVANLEPIDETGSTIQILDPDVADTKGRPRLLTIKERIKQNKFYSCSHCGSTKHTKKNCDQLHLVFNLPKRKRDRKKQEKGANAGNRRGRAKKVVAGQTNEDNPHVLETGVNSRT